MAVAEVGWGFARPTRRVSFGRRLEMVGVGVAIVAVLTANLYILTQRNVTTRVSLGDAVARLHRARSDTAGGGSAGAASTPAAAPPAVLADQPAAAPTRAAGPAAARAGARPPTVEMAAPPAPTQHASAQPYALPPEGVYAYATTGGESISVAGASHAYPSETYASVRHLGGCRWQNENDVIKEHVDTRTLCGEPGRFSQLAQGRQVTFYGKTDGGNFTCSPPLVEHEMAAAPGTTLTGACADSSTTATIAVTYVGREQRVVGGTAVDAVHLQVHSTMSGRVRGTEDEQFWILSTNGLVLQWDRSIDTLADAAFGANVRYQEHATFVLESLTPKG